MNLVLHIVRKDFRRLRLGLVLLALAPLVKVIIGILARSGRLIDTTPLEEKQWELTLGLLTWAQAIVTFFLALWLVQQDPLVGTRQFWLTRPISGGRLLAAKIAGAVLVLGGVPVVVCLPWWIASGFGVADFGWVALEMILMQCAIALPAVLVASLTVSIQRVLLWTMVVGFAAVAGISMWGFFVISRLGSANLDVAWARTWIPVAVLIVGALTTIGLQFQRQRRWRGLGVLIVSIVTAVLIAGAWPAAWVTKTGLTEFHPERAADVTLEFQRATSGSEKDEAKAGAHPVVVQVHVIAQHFPTGFSMQGAQEMSGDADLIESWRWPAGATLERAGWLMRSDAADNWGNTWHAVRAVLRLPEPTPDPETEAALQESWRRTVVSLQDRRKRAGLPPLPDRPWWPPQKPRQPGVADFSGTAYIPLSFMARMRVEPSAYAAEMWFDLARSETRFDIPLRVDGWYRHVGAGVRVLAMSATHQVNWRNSASATLQLVETWPTGLLDDWAALPFSHDRMFLLRHYGDVYVVNRHRGEMEVAYGGRSGGLRIASVHIGWRTLNFQVPKVSRNGQWIDVQPPWIDDAELALVGYQQEARFIRRLKVDDFLLAK